MQHEPSLRHLADDDVLARLAAVLRQSRRVEADLVAHIDEADARKLYAREACSSMFAYCCEVLHLSEAEAYLRITVARAARQHPDLVVMLRDGRLHLRGIAKLAPLLTVENRDQVLRRAVHRSKRGIDELVAELAPRPDVPTVMRKLPERWLGARATMSSATAAATTSATPASTVATPAPTVATPASTVATPATTVGTLATTVATPARTSATPAPTVATPVATPAAATAAGTVAPAPAAIVGAASPVELCRGRVGGGPLPPHDTRLATAERSEATIEPVAPLRYKVQFTAGAGLRAKLERLQALMTTEIPNGDLAAVIEKAVTEKLERLEAEKFGRSRTPRKALAETSTAPASRHVPATVRRAVHERGGSRCAYVDRQGRRCSENRRLEYHHRRPYGMGGDHSVRNVALLCRSHNQYLAEHDFGRKRFSDSDRAGPQESGRGR